MAYVVKAVDSELTQEQVIQFVASQVRTFFFIFVHLSFLTFQFSPPNLINIVAGGSLQESEESGIYRCNPKVSSWQNPEEATDFTNSTPYSLQVVTFICSTNSCIV